MPITMDEAALAWARLLLRAESAEAKVKELEEKLKADVRLPDKKE